MLVVMENRDVHPLATFALDREAFRRLDVLQVDAAEGRLQRGHDVHQFVGIGFGKLDVEDVDAGELLEQHRLAFHHRLGGERADRTEAQNRRTIGHHGNARLALAVTRAAASGSALIARQAAATPGE